MISPTAPSKLSAILTMSALRCSAARFSAACCSPSRRSTSRPFFLNTSTVRAISPSSSRRSVPGMSALKSLRASTSITDFNRAIGCDKPLIPIHSAAARPRNRPIPEQIQTMRIAKSASFGQFVGYLLGTGDEIVNHFRLRLDRQFGERDTFGLEPLRGFEILLGRVCRRRVLDARIARRKRLVEIGDGRLDQSSLFGQILQHGRHQGFVCSPARIGLREVLGVALVRGFRRQLECGRNIVFGEASGPDSQRGGFVHARDDIGIGVIRRSHPLRCKDDSPDRNSRHQHDNQADLQGNLEIVEPRHRRIPSR